MNLDKGLIRTELIAVAAMLLLVSCAGGERVRETVAVDGTAVPPRIQIATASIGGTYFTVGTAVAQVLTDNLDGVVATAENSAGSQQNIRLLDADEIHIGMANAAVTSSAVVGAGQFEKAFPVAAVISLQSSVAVIVALKDSGITTMQDLSGKRVTSGPAGGGWEYFVEPIIGGHGVAWDDFQQIYEGQANAMELLKDGAVDAVVVGGTVPHSTITSASLTHELAYLPYEPEALTQINAGHPFIVPVTIAAGTYEGQDEDLQSADSGTAQLLVRADADPDLVYLITKTIYENREAIAEAHPAGREITPERAAMDIGIPYHEGSLRYFSEIGILPDSLAN